MASTLARVTDFVPSTPILSAEVDGELNQLVNLLNGTSSNIKAVFKVSDAGDPPLELNQLSTGPIQEWYQGGILKATLGNDGGATLGGNLLILKDTPQIKLTNTGVSKSWIAVVNASGQLVIGEEGISNAIVIDDVTGEVTFEEIPVGPAANPTTASQLARKQYIDDQKARDSKTFFYPILPAAVETTESVGRWIIPAGQDITIEDITSVWAAGADSAASNVFTIKRRNAAGTLQTDVGTVDVNDQGQNVLNVSNPADVPLTSGDQVFPLFTTRNIASEQLVSITVRYFQKVKAT